MLRKVIITMAIVLPILLILIVYAFYAGFNVMKASVSNEYARICARMMSDVEKYGGVEEQDKALIEEIARLGQDASTNFYTRQLLVNAFMASYFDHQISEDEVRMMEEVRDFVVKYPNCGLFQFSRFIDQNEAFKRADAAFRRRAYDKLWDELQSDDRRDPPSAAPG